MRLKNKTMLRTEWKGIEERKYADMSFCEAGLQGRVGLLYMQRVEKPFYVPRCSNGTEIAITHTGYSWLQIAPKGENFWATVMFDEKGQLFETYFDITLQNDVKDDGSSSFTDLFLDLVLYADCTLIEVDMDELKQALEEKIITPEQYETALKAENRLKTLIVGNEQTFFRLCTQYRAALMEHLR